jgi:hypothetical protein
MLKFSGVVPNLNPGLKCRDLTTCDRDGRRPVLLLNLAPASLPNDASSYANPILGEDCRHSSFNSYPAIAGAGTRSG